MNGAGFVSQDEVRVMMQYFPCTNIFGKSMLHVTFVWQKIWNFLDMKNGGKLQQVIANFNKKKLTISSNLHLGLIHHYPSKNL